MTVIFWKEMHKQNILKGEQLIFVIFYMTSLFKKIEMKINLNI